MILRSLLRSAVLIAILLAAATGRADVTFYDNDPHNVQNSVDAGWSIDSYYSPGMLFVSKATGIANQISVDIGVYLNYNSSSTQPFSDTVSLYSLTGSKDNWSISATLGAWAVTLPANGLSAGLTTIALPTGVALQQGAVYELSIASNQALTDQPITKWAPAEPHDVGTVIANGPIFNGQVYGDSENLGAFSVLDVSAVPEPATWILLLLGLGVTAAVSRRSSALH